MTSCDGVSHKTQVLCDAMYPFPLTSPSGKYLFKMYFNGCAREVVIDDRLPVSSTARHLFAVDRRNPTLIWPALMEKAYLKVRGCGYDFPGSNSGTDLFILTGWIPEQLLLRDPELRLDKAWDRVKPFHEKGLVMFTLGTRSLSQAEEEVIGLIGDHDYAVLRMDDLTGDRKLLIKNPWKDCTTWDGVGATGSSAIPDCNPLVPGAFWMSLDDLVQNFEFAYLNWSPKLFAHRIDRHFQWQVSDSTHMSSHVLSPQFCVLPTTEGTIWILLSRHFADGELPIMQNCGNKSPAEVSKGLGFISLYVFLADGKRVEVDDHPLYSGSFLDSPQVLARIHVRPREPYTVVICQDCLPLPEYSFTLSVLSQGAICVDEAPERMTHYQSKRDSWTRTTAGGNLKSSRYPENPQYRLCLPAASPLTILLQCSNPDIPVHVGVSWGGTRVFCPKSRDMVGGSDKYRRGATMANLTTVSAGEYTIVCSTFEPNTFAHFTVRVGAMANFTLRDIPAGHAGRRITRAPNLVFHEGERRKRCPINIQRLTKFFARAAAPDKLPSLGIRLSLEVGQGFDSKQLTVSEEGEFGYESCGVRTPEIDLNPAAHSSLGIWLCVEIAGSFSSLRQVDVELLTDTGIFIGPWQVVVECC